MWERSILFFFLVLTLDMLVVTLNACVTCVHVNKD